MTTCNQAYRATHHAERQRGDTPKNRDCNTWLDGMVKPSLPPGAEPVAPAYIELLAQVQPS